MADLIWTIPEDFEFGHREAWKVLPDIRWWRPEGTTTESDILQQAYLEMESGRIEWRDVPVHIGER